MLAVRWFRKRKQSYRFPIAGLRLIDLSPRGIQVSEGIVEFRGPDFIPFRIGRLESLASCQDLLSLLEHSVFRVKSRQSLHAKVRRVRMVVLRKPLTINMNCPQWLVPQKHIHAVFVTVSDVVLLKVIPSQLDTFPPRCVIAFSQKIANFLPSFLPGLRRLPFRLNIIEPRWRNRESGELSLKPRCSIGSSC